MSVPGQLRQAPADRWMPSTRSMTVVVRVPLLLRKGYAEGAKRDKEVTGGRRFREPAPPSEDLPQAPGHQRQAWWRAMNSYRRIGRLSLLAAAVGIAHPAALLQGCGRVPSRARGHVPDGGPFGGEPPPDCAQEVPCGRVVDGRSGTSHQGQGRGLACKAGRQGKDKDESCATVL